MKKKYFNMVLALLACIGMSAISGCGKKDPFTVYTDAAKKTAELSSMEMTYDIDMTLELAGESLDMTTSSNAKMSGMNTDDMKINMAIKVGAQGQEMDMNVYYTDGYYYTDSMGAKIKYAMNLEQAQKELASTGLQTDIKKEDFKEISLEEQVLTFTIDGEKMSSLVDSAMSSLQGLIQGTDASIDIGDVKGTASVNQDGYFETSTMSVPLTMDIMGTEMQVNMDMDYTYVNPGKEVTVELPEDLADYEEIDMTSAESTYNLGDSSETSPEETDDTSENAA